MCRILSPWIETDSGKNWYCPRKLACIYLMKSSVVVVSGVPQTYRGDLTNCSHASMETKN